MRISLPIFIPLVLLGAASLLFAAEPIDLNHATLTEIQSLPIDSAKAAAIWERIYFEGPFENLYEISDLPAITPKDIQAIKDLVRVDPPRPGDERLTRIDDAYYRIENLGTEEGTNVGLVDEWIDRLLEPMNVNEATLDELMDLQNVSPADAVAIYKQVKMQGAIRGSRDLRAVPGLSSWGYRNARNYLGYDENVIEKKVHGSYTFRTYDTPFFYDEELAIDQDALVNPRPDVSHKLRVNYKQDFKSGLLWHRNLGEESMYQNWAGNDVPEFKWFAGVEKKYAGPVRFDRIYLGNYQVSLGQGVAMESGDYFNPRYSGFGFDKRITGIAPDLSRSQEFTMRGGAFEATYGKLKAVGFFSTQRKDAILNPDGSMNRLITLVPRTDMDIYPSVQKLANGDSAYVPAFDGQQSMLDAVREVGLGGEIAYRPWIGTSLGIIATEFSYDRPMHPYLGEGMLFEASTEYHDLENAVIDTVVEIYPVIDAQSIDEIKSTPMNAEILNGYHSEESGLWSESKSRRRVFGLSALNTQSWKEPDQF
jgi:DNA uptake protein ComE-like DNA-binding protein